MNTVPPTIVQNVHPPEPPLPTWPADQLSLFEDITADIDATLRPGWGPTITNC